MPQLACVGIWRQDFSDSASVAKHSPAMLHAHFVGDAFLRQAHELGEKARSGGTTDKTAPG
jgi:hypothetical protein